MSNLSEDELYKEISKILKASDLEKTSTSKVIKLLEKKFDTKLSEKRKLIDKLVMKYVNSLESEESEKEESEVEEEKKSEESHSEPEEKDDEASKDSDWSSRNRKRRRTEEPKKKGEPKAKKSSGGGAKGKGNGYTRPYKLSPALSDLMGTEALPRHEVVKRVWALIKERNLYDPNNKRFVVCDDDFYKVFGTQRFRAFGMMKYLKSHFMDG